MYPLFESIKVIDGQVMNLKWHQQRVDRSLRQLDITGEVLELASYLQIPENYRHGVVKCRVPYGRSLGPVEYVPYHRKSVKSLQQIECRPFDYQFKYQDRSMLDQLYQLREACDDVLITIDGMLTDTSYSNVALFDGTNWYTPEIPLLEGTQRAKLLSEGVIQTTNIKITDLGDFEKLSLINAMLEFDPQYFLSVSDIKLWEREKPFL